MAETPRYTLDLPLAGGWFGVSPDEACFLLNRLVSRGQIMPQIGGMPFEYGRAVSVEYPTPTVARLTLEQAAP